MTRSLEWTGNGAFRSEPLREWFVDGEVAGLTRSGGGLTFATIADAGHLVRPYKKHASMSPLVLTSLLALCRRRTTSPFVRWRLRTGGWRGRNCDVGPRNTGL